MPPRSLCSWPHVFTSPHSNMMKFGTLDSGENTIATLRDRWWSQSAKQEGDKTRKKVLHDTWKKRNERLKYCWRNLCQKKERPSVSKGMRGQWSNGHSKQQMSTPPPWPILYIGRVGVGWQRHCKTCRSLHELDHQGTVFWLCSGGSITAGGRVGSVVRDGKRFSPHKGNDRITWCFW